MKKVISVILALVMTAALSAAALAASGDVNGDNELDNKDVVSLFRYVSGNKTAVKNEEECDINGDGSVDNKDVVMLFRTVSGGSFEDEDDGEYENVVLYPFNGIYHDYDVEKLSSIFRFYLVMPGRSEKYLSVGERFQIMIGAEGNELYYDLSAKDVTFNVLSGGEYATISDDGVFTAIKPGTIKFQTVLNKVNYQIITYITIMEPKKVNTWEGSGTFRDPYLINTVEDFMKIHKVSTQETAESSSGYWYKQTADLDFSGIKYDPPKMFSGHYDGGGYKIKNVTVDPSNKDGSVFGMASNAVIKNVTIENFRFVRTSGEVGYAAPLSSHSISGLYAENCHVLSAYINIRNNDVTWQSGGFFGAAFIGSPCVFVNCSAKATITCMNDCGGFCTSVLSSPSAFINCKADTQIDSRGGTYGSFFTDDIEGVYVYDCECTGRDQILERHNIKTK